MTKVIKKVHEQSQNDESSIFVSLKVLTVCLDAQVVRTEHDERAEVFKIDFVISISVIYNILCFEKSYKPYVFQKD